MPATLPAVVSGVAALGPTGCSSKPEGALAVKEQQNYGGNPPKSLNTLQWKIPVDLQTGGEKQCISAR